MVITIICDVSGEANNGTTMATYNLIRFLAKNGHKLRVVSVCGYDVENVENYFVRPFKAGPIVKNVLKRNGVVLARKDQKVIRRAIEGCDVVHLQLPFKLGKEALKIAKELNKPVTASFHCQAENITAHIGLMKCKTINDLIYKHFYKSVYRYCDIIHYPTQFIKDVFESTTGCKTPGLVISNGVKEAFFADVEKKRLSDKFTIICSGRYSKEKHQQTLLNAVWRSGYKDNIKIILAGSGPCKKRLEKLANKLGLDCHFNFYSQEELVRALHGSDLYVHTSVVEIEAISCTEAIVCGLVPVINDSPLSATRNFALTEDNLYKKNDADSLAQRIKDFYLNPLKTEEIRRQYEVMKDSFKQSECMKSMEEMLFSAGQKNR